MTNKSRLLFRIIVLHGAPRGRHEATETYLVVAGSDPAGAVFEWIDSHKAYNAWTADDNDEDFFYGEDNETEIPFREWVILNRGDLQDERGWEDAYYGVTKWGWDQVIATESDIDTLLRLGIAIKADINQGGK